MAFKTIEIAESVRVVKGNSGVWLYFYGMDFCCVKNQYYRESHGYKTILTIFGNTLAYRNQKK